MESFMPYIIKSFKHDGHLHRMWIENWLVPEASLHPDHAKEEILVLINSQTKIQEADGKEWISRIPGVSFFIPKAWYNVVALLEETGVRYYCNIASPPYVAGNVITYIDYDLDVIRFPDGMVQVVDQEEYDRHRLAYHYSAVVEGKVRVGLEALLKRIQQGGSLFQEELVLEYYRIWETQKNGGSL
jgi:protein associated with RNAse G/E